MKILTFALIFSLVLFAYYGAFKFFRFVYVRIKAHLIYRKILKSANSDSTDLEKKMIRFICDILGVAVPVNGTTEYYIIFVFASAIVLSFAVALVRFCLRLST